MPIIQFESADDNINFKREVWDSERNSDLQKDNESRVNKVAEFGSGWYKKHLWTKKEYN